MIRFYITREKGLKFDDYDTYYSLWEGKPRSNKSKVSGFKEFYSWDNGILIEEWGDTRFPFKDLKLDIGDCIEVGFCPIEQTKKKKKKKGNK